MVKRIMTVDDSATIRQVLSMSLTDAGYEVVEAVDGQDALEKIQSENIVQFISQYFPFTYMVKPIMHYIGCQILLQKTIYFFISSDHPNVSSVPLISRTCQAKMN